MPFPDHPEASSPPTAVPNHRSARRIGLFTAGLFVGLIVSVLAAPALCQRVASAPGPGGIEIPYTVCEPVGYDKSKMYPVAILPWVGPRTTTSDQPLRALAKRGWVVVRHRRSKQGSLADVFRHLRLTYRIATQRFFLHVPSSGARRSEARSWVADRPSDIHVVEHQASTAQPTGEALATYVELMVKTYQALVPKDAQVRAVSAVLDDFHDCAAKADGPRYFGHFAPQGVFLGTDATERWSQAEFRAFGRKYFERESAWIYVPQRRNVDVVGDFAWFDEILRNDSYGECRGSGALQKIGGVWKIAQYHLTVPVPNPLLGDVAAMIRVAASATKATGATTVFVVRHAEKLDAGRDPGLTAAGRARAERLGRLLRSVKIAAAYATQFQRTQKTAAPTAATGQIPITALDARIDVVEKILREHGGQAVLVVGHSNTVPGILRRLGVTQGVRMTESDYGDLFVVTVGVSGKSRVIHLHY